MHEDDLVQRAADERAAIVAKYQHGRREGAKIDPWEEPTFDIYRALDRYGFIHDEGVGEVAHPAEVKVEMEREKKWLKMLSQWERVPPEKLKRRVFKGIPNSLRGKAWKQMLEVDKLQKKHRGKYQEMRDLAWKWSSEIRQIDLDVNRTYRDHFMFRERYNSKQQELFNVLGAYSIYNSEIGYCQGMSQIAALLLMYLDEEDAFWALSILVSDKKYNMHGFFIPGFPKLLRYQEHHDKIMHKFLPKLKKHLDKNGVDTGIYTLKWFFQCFLDRIPFRLTLRVWDVYLYIGERILTAMAYNLLKLHRRKLNSLGMDEILQFLQVHLERKFEMEDDAAMESLSKCLDELRRSKLDYAGTPPQQELPKRPFGSFKEPTFEQKVPSQPSQPSRLNARGSSPGRRPVTEPKPAIVVSDPVGRRSSEFSSVERSTREVVTIRRDAAAASALTAIESPTEDDDPSPSAPNGHARHLPNDASALPGSKFSLEQGSMEGDGSSLLGDGSRRSLAETSVTSTADLSVFSSAPRSQAADARSTGEQDQDTDAEDEGGRTPTPTSSRSPDVLRIYVPYEPTLAPFPSTDSQHPLSSPDNKIRILVMDHTPPGGDPEDNTPLVELASPPFTPVVDLK